MTPSSDPRRPDCIVEYKAEVKREEDDDPDVAGFVAVVLSIVGLMIRNRTSLWVATVFSVESYLNQRASEGGLLGSPAATIMFSTLSLLMNYLPEIAAAYHGPAIGSVRTLLNKATIIGRVGQDAESTNIADRTVVHFSVATSENYKDAEGNIVKTTHWHRIVSWDQRKNPYLTERVKKGDLVYVEGPIHYRSYMAKDGTEKHLTEIALRSFQALTPKEHQ
ncbi:hypothetical protein FBU30_007019 [Linnemannia zychae]|nr:hypothetical protein FBU30_007019 [Linnemannia zychae]